MGIDPGSRKTGYVLIEHSGNKSRHLDSGYIKLNEKAIIKEIQLSADIISKSSNLTPKIEKSINLIIEAIKNGNKIILFGNGGSAANAIHIANDLHYGIWSCGKNNA